jgi:hypothetical protein
MLSDSIRRIVLRISSSILPYRGSLWFRRCADHSHGTVPLFVKWPPPQMCGTRVSGSSWSTSPAACGCRRTSCSPAPKSDGSAVEKAGRRHLESHHVCLCVSAGRAILKRAKLCDDSDHRVPPIHTMPFNTPALSRLYTAHACSSLH